jgi:hypothetical protein
MLPQNALNTGFKLNELYLCVNISPSSQFQVIYRDNKYEWAILPQQQEDGLMKINSKFSKSWQRRKRMCFGLSHRVLNGLIWNVSSWTTALATIEEFEELLSMC